MDVARYGDYATLAYTNAKVQENYRRRFRITFPNEELPAGRPLLTTPIHDRLTAANAVWGATMGLEHALWFQKAGLEPTEDVTFHRSNAWECVAEEVAAVRERVGMTEISNYAKYRVTGQGAGAWLSSLLTAADAGARPDHADGDAQRRGPDRRRVHRRPAGRGGRVLPVRVAPGRGPPLALVPAPPAARRLRAGSRSSGLGLVGLSVTGPAVARRPGRRRARPRPLDRGVPVHDLPAGRPRDDAGAPRPDQLLGRPRLRALGRARSTSGRCSTGSSPRASRTACGCSGCGR